VLASIASTTGSRRAERAAIEGELFHEVPSSEAVRAEGSLRGPGQIEALTDKNLGRFCAGKLRRRRASVQAHSSFARRLTARPARGCAPRFTNSLRIGWSDYWVHRAAEYEEILGYHLEQKYRIR